jgi:cytochrome c
MKRGPWERGKVAVAIALAAGTLMGSVEFAGWVMAPTYPLHQSFPVEGVPPVDLASVQRAWPGGVVKPGDRELLQGYIRDIEAARVAMPKRVAPAGPAAPLDLGALLATADPVRGEHTAQVCASCHSFGPGEPNRVGPNLHGVVGRPIASHPGFNYSAALAGAGGRWTYEALDHFLTSPARAFAGTKMTFAGFRNPRDRAQVIAYLAEITPGAPRFPAPGPPESPAKVAHTRLD